MTRAEHAKRKGRSSSQLLRPEKRQRIYSRDRWRCLWCGRRASDGAKLTIDHFQARAYGGGNETTNLLTACSKCNCKRKDTPALHFADLDVLAEIREQLTRPLPRFVP